MKVRFHVKAQDDAIQEQGQIINNINQHLDRFLREFDRWVNEPVNGPEFNVNLSDQSPFKKLDVKKLKDRQDVERVWKELPRFMYLPEELEQFKKEYDELISAIALIEKKKLATSLNKTLAFIQSLPDDEKVKEDTSRVGKFTERIQKRAAAAQANNLPNLTGAKSLAELVVTLQPFIQTLKA